MQVRIAVERAQKKRFGSKVVVQRAGERRVVMFASRIKKGKGFHLDSRRVRFAVYRAPGVWIKRKAILVLEDGWLKIYSSEDRKWAKWAYAIDDPVLEAKPYSEEGGVVFELDDLEWED